MTDEPSFRVMTLEDIKQWVDDKLEKIQELREQSRPQKPNWEKEGF